jgi:hypothetical protein
MAEYCCSCIGILYCCYGSLIISKICKDEYKERIKKFNILKREYDNLNNNSEHELSNIRFTNLESKLSTIREEDDDELY